MRLQLLILGFSGVAAFSEVAPYKQSQRIAGQKYKWELDADAMLAQSTFPIKPDALIMRAKDVIDHEVGINRPGDLAEDFVFQFPVVGPLTKQQYLKAVGGFKLTTSFPDYFPGFHNFHVDPVQPNRVWYTSRFTGTNSGDGPPPFGKATNIAVECPPQAISLTFNEQGQVTLYTGGYVMDKLQGNSGGMGGIFGPLYAVGKGFPFREAQPWKPSTKYRLFNWVGGLVSKFAPKPKDE
jgi:hypothetical protein